MGWNKPLEDFELLWTKDGLTLHHLSETIEFKGKILTLKTESGNDIYPAVSLIRHQRILTLNAPFMAQQDDKILEVRWLDGEWSGVDDVQIAGTRFGDICVFLRSGACSFFLSLDFPYSRVDGTCVTYDPHLPIRFGEEYSIHTLSIGAVLLWNHKVGLYDRGEIEGMSAYIDMRIPPRFDRSIFSSTCITNQMTDVREGRIFYSMYNNPTITLDPETLKREVRLCAELGIEYFQLFEGYFDWEEGISEANLEDIMRLANELGVRIGDYMTPSALYCAHYNYRGRRITNDEWRILSANGERGQLCYGRDELIDYLKETLVESMKKHGQQFICLDGSAVQPCFDPAHEHGPGLYAQVRGLVKFIEAMNALDDNFLTWSNSGNWLHLMPKLLWYNQNVYLTDPHPRAYSSSLNTLKYYGDCRREQMVTVHNEFFVPYKYFCNCEYYAFPHSRVDDMAFFEYSFLQGLCVTPNICLAELRTFFDRIPASKVDSCKAFMKKWMDFVKANYGIWKNVYQLGDAPGAGANEAYAHTDGKKGWICFVNQNPYSQQHTFRLDSSIGLTEGSHFLLVEEYPDTCPIAEQGLPYTLYGAELTLEIPAYSVRIVRIEAAGPTESGVRLYGLSGSLQREGNRFLASIAGECGRQYSCAVALDQTHTIEAIRVQTVPTVPLYTFETVLKNVEIHGNLARFDVVMPRDYFQREISRWRVDGASEPIRLTAENSDFCGAYLHNFYREAQYAELEISFSDEPSAAELPPVQPANTAGELPCRRGSVYETNLDIPFMEWPVMARGYGFDEVLELAFSDANEVSAVRAFLDEKPCEVYTYRYPTPKPMKTFYIEMIGHVRSGTKPLLRLEVEWKAQEQPKEQAHGPAEKTSGAYVMGQG